MADYSFQLQADLLDADNAYHTNGDHDLDWEPFVAQRLVAAGWVKQPDGDYGLAALRAVLMSRDVDIIHGVAQAGIDLITLGPDGCAEMRGDNPEPSDFPVIP